MAEKSVGQEFWDSVKAFKTEPLAETYHPNVVVASFDILGFGGILKSAGGTKKAAGILKNFYQNASFTMGFHETKSTVEELSWRLERYSDSVFMYGNPSESVAEQLRSILILAGKTIMVGFHADRPYPVRCGIGVGDLQEVLITTLAGNVTYYTGTSILNAHALEKCQQWAGGAIHSDLDEHLPVKSLSVPYQIPFKEGANPTSNYAIDWIDALMNYIPPKGIDVNIDWLSNIDTAFENPDNILDVEEKKANTVKFYRDRRSHVN